MGRDLAAFLLGMHGHHQRDSANPAEPTQSSSGQEHPWTESLWEYVTSTDRVL